MFDLIDCVWCYARVDFIIRVCSHAKVTAALTTRIGCGYAHCAKPKSGVKYTTAMCNYGYG